MQRALSPQTKEAVAALRENFVTDSGSPKWETLKVLDQLKENSEKNSREEHSKVGYGEILQRVLASPEGSALRRIIADLDVREVLRGTARREGHVKNS